MKKFALLLSLVFVAGVAVAARMAVAVAGLERRRQHRQEAARVDVFGAGRNQRIARRSHQNEHGDQRREEEQFVGNRIE